MAKMINIFEFYYVHQMVPAKRWPGDSSRGGKQFPTGCLYYRAVTLRSFSTQRILILILTDK
eukprot:scaffold15669_cov160-Amphora_coffeaeformis.AAC.10